MKQTASLILAALLIAGGVWYGVRKDRSPSSPVVDDTTADWKTYQNEEYGFGFKYPPAYYLLPDLVLDEKTGQFHFSSQVQALNRGLTKESADGEVWVHVLDYSSLPKTIAEGCEEAKRNGFLDPQDKCDPMYAFVSQEELRRQKEGIGTKLLNDETHANRVVEVDKERGTVGLWYSRDGQSYIASFSVFDRNNNKITIDIPIKSAKGVGDKEKAAQDLSTAMLDHIISTFRF